MLPILEKEKGWENGVDLQMKRASTILFSIWINGWSINQSSVEYQQKSLIIDFSNTAESKLALRRPWQDYRTTELSNKTCHGAGSL